MAQDQLGITRRDAQGLEESGGRVARVMDSDSRNARMLREQVKGASEIAWLHGSAGLAGKHESVTERARIKVLGQVEPLPRGEREQALADDGKQRQRAAAGACLDRPGFEPAVDALYLLINEEDVVAEIDAAPAQADNLAATHAVEDEELVPHFPHVAFRRFEEAGSFCGGPRLDLLSVVRRQVHKACDIPSDAFFADGSTQGRRQDRAELVD